MKTYKHSDGTEYPLEDWAKWIAIDRNGQVFQFEYKPINDSYFIYWLESRIGQTKFVCDDPNNPIPWDQSLEAV